MIKLEIHGEPKALQRHRTAIISGCQKQYDPQSRDKTITRGYLLAEKLRNGWELSENGYSLTVNLFFYRPPSLRKMTEEELNKELHTRKPDIDNCIKYIFDCGNQILWHDDAEIYSVTSRKYWSKKPRTEIIWDSSGAK